MKRTEGYFLSTVQACFPPYFYKIDSLCSSLSNCIWISRPLFSCKHFCLWNWVRKSGVCSHSLCFYPLLLVFAPIGQGRYDALIAARVTDAECHSVLLSPTEEAEGWQKIDREDLWMNKTMHASYFSSLGCAVSKEFNLEARPLKYDKWVIYCAVTYQLFIKEGIWGEFYRWVIENRPRQTSMLNITCKIAFFLQ